MTDPVAEAINWALERAAVIAEEACECGVGKKLAAAIRELMVDGETVVCVGTPEELEEMGILEQFAKLRGPIAEANARAINAAADNTALTALPPPRAIVAAEGPGEIGAAPIAADAIAPDHVHDRRGPMIPVGGVYRVTCSCGHVER